MPEASSTLGQISWIYDFTDGLQQAKNNGTPVLFYFTTEETQAPTSESKLSRDINVTCIVVILQTNKKDKEKDDLYQINKLLNTSDSSEKAVDNVSESVKLGVKYKITFLPQTVWADCYGNELQKGNVKAFSDKSSSVLNKEAVAAIDKQKKREADLTKQYSSIEKQIEIGKEKKDFSAELISKVQPIAKYDGWEPSVKAKSVVEEISGVAGKELEQILAQLNNPDIKKEKVMGDLNKFNGKYNGLPVTKISQDKLKELAKKEPEENKKDK